MLRPFITCATFAILSAPAHAEREPPFRLEPGVTLGVGAMHGVNTNPDGQLYHMKEGQYVLLQVGYRFATGFELLASAGVSPNVAKEELAATLGVAARQRVRLGPVQPFVEAGYYLVGDDVSDPGSVGLGAGIDWQIVPRAAFGVAGGHYLGSDGDQDLLLDWYARAQLTVRVGG